jgi:hypothetical protein
VSSYSVILTKGAHIVPAEDAALIVAAIEAGEKILPVRSAGVSRSATST